MTQTVQSCVIVPNRYVWMSGENLIVLGVSPTTPRLFTSIDHSIVLVVGGHDVKSCVAMSMCGSTFSICVWVETKGLREGLSCFSIEPSLTDLSRVVLELASILWSEELILSLLWSVSRSWTRLIESLIRDVKDGANVIIAEEGLGAPSNFIPGTLEARDIKARLQFRSLWAAKPGIRYLDRNGMNNLVAYRGTGQNNL